jgi:uncharacterized membrane protein (DUF106 family)
MQTGSYFPPFYNALMLKVAGIVLIVGTLVDYVMLAIPSNFSDGEWSTTLFSALVSRGAVPLLGLGLLFLGVWFDRDRAEADRLGGFLTGALIVSALLGLLFLVLAPLYFNSSRLANAVQIRQIDQQATQAEKQLDLVLEQQRQQVSAIVSDQDQLAQLQQQLNSLDLPEDQQLQLEQVKSTLEKVKSDPKALDQEVTKARTKGLNQIKEKQQQALSELQSKLQRDQIHMAVTSLLFAVGYFVIAWIGLGGRIARTR